MREAGEEDFTKVPGIGKAKAKSIFEALHQRAS